MAKKFKTQEELNAWIDQGIAKYYRTLNRRQERKFKREKRNG